MEKLSTLATKYAELDSQEKLIKKQKDPLNKEIKDIMKSSNLSNFEVDGIKLSYTEQSRKSMNEDKLVEKLKSFGLHEAIVTVEKPNEEVIAQLIYEGKLSAHDLESCVTTKYVGVLKVSGGKK